MSKIDDLNNHPRTDGWTVTTTILGSVADGLSHLPIFVAPRDLIIEAAYVWVDGDFGSAESFAVNLEKVASGSAIGGGAAVDLSASLTITDTLCQTANELVLDSAREDRTVNKTDMVYLDITTAATFGTNETITVSLFVRAPDA